MRIPVKNTFLFFSVMTICLSGLAQTLTIRQYIDTFRNIAMREMIDFKIPASITLAQGLLESGSGNSRLAVKGNNHFGIKCKKDWTGCTIQEDDDALQECFRCYADAEESYKDHSRFLRDNKRYAALFELDITDYRGWAKGLLAAGYATNKKYADLLVSTIERNGLARFDSLVLSGYNPYSNKMPANIETVYNNVPSTVVQPEQSLGNIAVANNKTERKISKYNDLGYHRDIQPGDVIYLRPKKRKASVSTHQVSEGETMWSISQKYAIRINSLYRKNLMDEGTEPLPGTTLQLQQKAAGRPDTGRIMAKPPKPDTALSGIHVVSGGETLYGVSRMYKVSVEELTRINNLSSSQLYIGQKLKVRNTVKESSATLKHTVIAGETLYSIARLYKVSVADIKAWNKLGGDSLSIGQELEIRNN
jgi:LysM repeat protein